MTIDITTILWLAAIGAYLTYGWESVWRAHQELRAEDAAYRQSCVDSGCTVALILTFCALLWPLMALIALVKR